MPARFSKVFPAALVWAGFAAFLLGLCVWHSWEALRWARIADRVVLIALSIGLAALLRAWRRWPLAHALALVWLVALVWFAGPLPVLATLLIAAAAVAAGAWVVGADSSSASPLLALATGLVLIAGIVGWLLPWPIHRSYVYLPLLAGICVLGRRGLQREVAAAWQGFRSAVSSAPAVAAMAVLLLGIASSAAWLPTMQADDLAYHLGLPSQLQFNGVYRLDPAQQIWTLAPWLGDVLQGIAQVLAGREARGPVNVLWMLLAAAGLWNLTAQMKAGARTAWISVALFASLPLLAGLLAGMQTELPAVALLSALVLAVVLGSDARVLTVLAAGLVALKFGQLVAALIVLGWAAVRCRGRMDWKRLPALSALFLVLAGSSYFYAWHVSGNPMLPLFNNVFHSHVMPGQQLFDPRWHDGFRLALPWLLTFDTPRYFEGGAGSFGFVLIAFGGAWLLALIRPETRGLTAAMTLVAFLPLVPMQYARYAFPGLVLLLPPLLAASRVAAGERALAAIAGTLCIVQVGFQAGAIWPLQVGALRKFVISGGSSERVLRYAPERALIAELRRRDDSASIVLALDPEAPFVAELAGRGRSVAWYAPALEVKRIAADADATGKRWQQLIRELRARWLLVRPDRLTSAQRAALASGVARRVDVFGNAELWEVAR